MELMPELSYLQYSIVTNVMSLCTATMAAGAIFLFFARNHVAPKYRISVLISAIVPAIAAYHYYRIGADFTGAYMLADSGRYVTSGMPFNDFYRYADWLITVPLLTTELILVLGLAAKKTFSLAWRLGLAAALMIVLGYPGEVAEGTAAKMIWWALAMIPFIYILFVLFTEFTQTISEFDEKVRKLVNVARWTLLITWSFYPIAYLGPVIGLGSAGAEVFLQVGYTIADILAKVGFGVLIFTIAVTKSRVDGWNEERAVDPKLAPT